MMQQQTTNEPKKAEEKDKEKVTVVSMDENENGKYQLGFKGSIVLPANINRIWEIQQGTGIWVRAYRKVALDFPNKETKIEPGIDMTAQADGENVPAHYEVAFIDEIKKNIRVALGEDQETIDNFFKDAEIMSKLVEIDENNTTLELSLRADEKGSWGSLKARHLTIDLPAIIKDAIKQALNRFKRYVRNIDDPIAQKTELAIEDSVKKMETTELPTGYTYGYQSTYTIPAPLATVNQVINDYPGYKENLNDRLEFNSTYSAKNKELLKFNLPKGFYVMLGLKEAELITEDNKQNRVFESTSGIAMIHGIRIGLETSQTEDNKTICKMQFCYSYQPGGESAGNILGWATGVGKINSLIGPMGEGFVATTTRHLNNAAVALHQQNIQSNDEIKKSTIGGPTVQ